MKRAAVFLGMLMFLVSCAQLGLEKTDDKAGQIAYAYVTIAETRQSAALALRQKRITVQQARQVQDLADTARVAVDEAARLHFEGKSSNAERALQMVEVLLNQAQNIVRAADSKLPQGGK